MLIVNQSDSASFYCNATGIPPPVIRWFRDTEELITAGSGDMSGNLATQIDIMDLGENIYLTPGGNVLSVESILTIHSTVSNDSGQYRCNASNIVGASMIQADDEENTTLFVQGETLYIRAFL